MKKVVNGHTGVIPGLLHTAVAVHARLEDRLAPVGLSLPKLAALTALRDSGDSLTLSLLADRLSCVRSNITQLVDRLESDGFVRREADPNDRRARVAVLTTAGRTACDLGRQVRAEAEAEILAGFSPDDTEQLANLVERVARSAK